MKHFVCLTLLCGSLLLSGKVFADKFVLRDGQIIEGNMTLLSRVDEKADAAEDIARPIVLIDDGLRYIYLSKSQIRQPIKEPMPSRETFRTGQVTNYTGIEYYIPGNYSNSTPFDEYGRRLLHIHHSGGTEYAQQAIVSLNPYYISVTSTSVTSIRANTQPLTWNMRIATNAVPRDQITPILMKLIDAKNMDDRIKLARFYFDGGLYSSADAELESIMQDWKDSPKVQQQILPMSLNIRRQKYQQILDELDLRWDSGQYQFYRKHIAALEEDPKLPELMLETVRRKARRYDETEHTCQEIVSVLKELYEQLPESDKNDKIPPIMTEIEKELNFATLRRLTTFQLYAKDAGLSAAEKLAIAITGWYAGAEADNSRLAVAVTLPETEKLIRDYLRSGPNSLLRRQVLEQLNDLETSSPELVAAILATMKPPFSDLPPDDPQFPGYYRCVLPNPLFVPGAVRGQVPEFQYAVQLPPDYNPYQRYPMVVSLHGLYQTPEMQLDWWAGSWWNGERMGHATRHGYIVVAPAWNPPETALADYDFSVYSHAAVICSVKDAFRRFSVDTDNVFISGHGIGGTAAWDIALAHPDMWAGAIALNATASKYIDVYDSAVRHVPLYLVWGEMEGDGVSKRRKWTANALVLNRYLGTLQRPGDVTAVRYIGRGMEGFSEEILHVLEWMKPRRRNAVPLNFSAETMRPWDSFFWWVEMPNLQTERQRNMYDPVDFPARNVANPIKVESSIYRATNSVLVTIPPRTGKIDALIYLTPDMIDFSTQATVKVNDKNYHPPNGMLKPDIGVMLEDARVRCDRLHPFWVMLTGK